jgi:glutaredoxin
MTSQRHSLLWLGFLLLLSQFGCERNVEPDTSSPVEPVGDAPLANELPPLELKDDTADLLLTWLDAKGDFHVVQTPADVPPDGRENVRVVVTTKEAGAGRLVYVADLRTKSPEGTYLVKTMTRAQWNELGAVRRKVRMEEVAKAAPPEGAHPAADQKASAEPTAKDKTLNAKVRAVVYGADWCKPCHDAEAYLKKLGVDVTKKDIEKSRAARAEMNERLASAGRMGASIPVLDIGGKVIVGFSRGAVLQAVEAARKPETL